MDAEFKGGVVKKIDTGEFDDEYKAVKFKQLVSKYLY